MVVYRSSAALPPGGGERRLAVPPLGPHRPRDPPLEPRLPDERGVRHPVRPEDVPPRQRVEGRAEFGLGEAPRVLEALAGVLVRGAGLVLEAEHAAGLAPPVGEAGAVAERQARRERQAAGVAREVGVRPVGRHRLVERQAPGRR
jgi:hypothetical protein